MPAVEVSGQEGLTVWRIPELGLEFELPVTLIADLIAAAKEGFNRFPRGGLEVGGVLFGRREGARVRVMAARSVACKHLLGPSFTLTSEEHEELAALLVQARQDPQLAGLIPVGWYHSHTRSGLIYTDADAHLHNRHFSQAWQFGLLLRPEVGKPTQIALFVRTKDGELPLRPALVVQEDSLAAGAAAGNEQLENQPESGPSEPGGSGPKLLPRQRSKVLWAASAALAALAAAALGWPALLRADWGASWQRIVDYWWPQREPEDQRPFQLALAAEGGRVTVSWNPAAPGFRSARDVKLEVRDGAEGRELTLDAAAVARGSLTLARNSDHVTVTLSVAGGAGGSPQETAHLVGSAPESSSGPLRLPALLEEKERLEAALKVQRAEADTLAEQRALLAKLLESRPAREPPPPKARPEVAEKAPEPAAPQVTLEQRPAAISPAPPVGAIPGGAAAARRNPPPLRTQAA
jgi:proteasome lid subunit RPN8/RPN11